MTSHPERSPERDAAIAALLPHVPFDGWTLAALRRAAGPEAGLLFSGPLDLVEAHSDLADRRMAEGAAMSGMPALRLSERVRAVIAIRLRQNRADKDAVRRGLAVLAWPGHAATGAAVLARTADAIWHAAGDRSADASWYSKRAILAGIYAATLLYWLRDTSEDDAATLAFLDRRLAGAAGIGRLRRRLLHLRGRGQPAAR